MSENFPKLSIVIPCYKSENYLEKNVLGIIEEIKNDFKFAFEILLVVDGSPDKTIEIAKELAANYPEIKTIELSKNYGQHAALFAGIAQSQGELILTMDDDGQHTPEGVCELLNSLKPESDVIYGISLEEEHHYFRSFMSRLTKRMIFQLLGIRNARNISAFRLIRREVFSHTDFTSLSRGTLDVIINWNTSKVTWTNVKMQRRPHGKSNYKVMGLIQFAIEMITNYSTRPLRFATVLGTFGFIVSSILAIYFAIAHLVGKITMPGYASLAILISVLGSIQLLTLGILGEYLAKVHEKSSGKPQYSIRKIWN